MVSMKETADSPRNQVRHRESRQAIIETTHNRIYENLSSESCDFMLMRETHDSRYFGSIITGRGTRKCILHRIKILDQFAC
jgi:hypothetical protein